MGKNAQRKRALKEERRGRQASAEEFIHVWNEASSAEDANLNVETKNERGGVVDDKHLDIFHGLCLERFKVNIFTGPGCYVQQASAEDVSWLKDEMFKRTGVAFNINLTRV